MRGNASILWPLSPRIELLPTPDPETEIGVLGDGEWNGSLLRVVSFSEVELTVAPSSYSHLAAARKGMGPRFPLFLAVTGVTRIGGGFILGKRANTVADGGVWEFAPSGGVQSLPLEHQIVNEAKEELGFSIEVLAVDKPLALYADYSAFTADVIFPLRVSLSEDEFLRSFTPGEYERVEIVSRENVSGFLKRNATASPAVTEFIVSLIAEGWITDSG